MKLKQTSALLLAGAMMVGTIGMMNPTQVQAADPAPTNQYTLTVPAETTLAYDGSAEALTNGLKVSGGDLEEGKKVTVTASSANEWKLKGSKTETTTTIAYGLYATAGATETTTSWDFSKADAAGDGTTVDIYSKIVADDYKNATADDYSDTITFTAEVKANAPTPAPVTVAGMTINAAEGMTWEEIAAINENVVLTGDRWNRIQIDGNYIYSGAYVTANDTYSASKEYTIA